MLDLLIAGSIPRWIIPINKWHAKPEHFVAAGCCLVLLFRIGTGSHHCKALGRVEILVLAFLGMNFFSSAVASPDPSLGLRWSLLLALVVLPFFLIHQMVDTPERLSRVMVLWLCVGALEALFGMLCFLSYLGFGTEFGVTVVDFLGFVPQVHSTQWEPNIFGSYCTCIAMMFLFYFLADARHNRWYLAGFVITTVGALLSEARQSFLCLILVGAAVLLYNLRSPKIQWKRAIPVAVAALIAVYAGTAVMEDFSDRVASLTGDELGRDPTVVRRMTTLAMALDDIKEHPTIGLGA
ncbi:MAG: hypothetical protein WCA20_32865, partial [Candidatus Sulfotelmatobacter sp.]